MPGPARWLDPTGARHNGLPTYPWGWARVYDPDLATKSQLAALGLRPGGQDPSAQLKWRSPRAGSVEGVRTAALYRISRAAPKRPMTEARERSINRALLARHTCRTCGAVWDCCLPTSMGGHCPPCYDAPPPAEAAAA